ncbi:MAG: hypothetical protein PHW31_00355 [Candidatus Pacebacteria bacterium]|nr:hypothetical protein [Candidatus Paceibacterota bacterium]
MAREEIIEKLNKFLLEHSPLTEECQVVYLMVEIRKILDHKRSSIQKNTFPLIRFYCDWIVHTEKTKITNEMRMIMNRVFHDAKSQVENSVTAQVMPSVIQFAYMEDLHKEMEQFLGEYNISVALVNKDSWLQYVQLLVKVLENQPIKDPTSDVTSFYFAPTAKNCVRGIIIFSQPINGCNFYQFVNIY